MNLDKSIKNIYSITADLHCDTVLQMRRGYDISVRHQDYHVDIPRLKDGGVNLQIFTCLAHPYINGNTEFDTVNDYLDILRTEISRNKNDIEVCLSFGQSVDVIENNRIAAVLAIEGGTAINDDPENLEYFYNQGVRLMTLVHEKSTGWCISWSDQEPLFSGINDLGRAIISKMNELGMIIDVSHCSDLSAAEAIEISKKPVMASHSCARSLSPTNRNLSDDLIKAIASKGGLIGVTFVYFMLSPELNKSSGEWRKKYPDEIKKLTELFVSAEPEDKVRREMKNLISKMGDFESLSNPLRPTVSDVVDHIDYIVNLAGVDHVGIGSDFDGMPMPPRGLDDCSGIPNIAAELINRGYTKADISKILGGNFMRLFKEICG